MIADTSWVVERVAGPAAELHAASAALTGASAPARSVRVLDAVDAAVVLGSAQRAEDIDAAAAARAGVAVVRRRSGGGAVLVGPGRCVWADVLIAREDPLWDDDVRRAPRWLGEAWASALGRIGLGGAEVWRTMTPRTFSARICFAGAAPGEVLVEGRKVVGISQRRTRGRALFQCAALVDADPDPLLAVLALDPDERRSARAALRGGCLGIGAEAVAPLVEALAGPDGVLHDC